MLVDLHFLLSLAPARHVGVHDQVLVNVSQGDPLLSVREGGGRGGEEDEIKYILNAEIFTQQSSFFEEKKKNNNKLNQAQQDI